MARWMLPPSAAGNLGLVKSPAIICDVSIKSSRRTMQKYFSIYPQHALSYYPLPPPDVNDNVPFFTSSIYEASITEGAESGTLVFQVSANDLDLGLNGKVKTDSHMHTHCSRSDNIALSARSAERDVRMFSFQSPFVIDYPKCVFSCCVN